MKIREGFVSNSSSSSFIVASNKEPKVFVEINLADISEKIYTKEQLDDYFVHYFYFYLEENNIENIITDPDFEIEIYQKCLEEVNKGNIVYIGDVSSFDIGIGSYIYDHGLSESPSYKIISPVFN